MQHLRYSFLLLVAAFILPGCLQPNERDTAPTVQGQRIDEADELDLGSPSASIDPDESEEQQPVDTEQTKNPHTLDKAKWNATSLDRNDLDNWQIIRFGGEGKVFSKDGVLNLDLGSPMTGVKYTGKVEKLFGPELENYAITLKAKRVEGIDMFLGLTFPVGKKGHVSLILGGWAGAVTGISNLDGMNASENATTQYHAFKDNQWYDVKILLTEEKIECWLGDKKIVDEPRADYDSFTTHGSVTDTVPFGLFTYGTWGAYKDFKVWTPKKP